MKDIDQLTYGRTSVYNLNYHIVWGTRYHNKVLKGHIEDVLKQTLLVIASKYDFSITSMRIDPDDYVHLIVSSPPKLSVTNIVRWLKGESAKFLFKECPELESVFSEKQERHIWSPNYYVESIGTINESAVIKYIKNQNK